MRLKRTNLWNRYFHNKDEDWELTVRVFGTESEVKALLKVITSECSK